LKRPLGGAYALAALCVLLAARPAAAVTPVTTPQFVRPDFSEGFEPIPPDEFGVSPNFEFLVIQDEDGLHVIRLVDDVETFTLGAFTGPLQIGFDPSDHRLFLLEPQKGGSYRFRFIDPNTGEVLRSDRLNTFPEIRTNFDATVNVLASTTGRRTDAVVFDKHGDLIYRRSYSSLVRFSLNVFFPVVAFVDPQAGGQIRIEVLDAFHGVVQYRESVPATSIVGFAPFGPDFVVARPLSSNSFRVRLVNGLNGLILVTRSFTGSVNVGFTPDGSLLGVITQRGLNQDVFLFRTFDGSQVFLR
jgi:hypothetical protein